MASPLKYTYPFSRLNEFNRDQYDAWISGIECPLVAGVNTSSAEVIRSAGINVKLKVTDTDHALLQKWLTLGNKCVTFKDDCLALATEQKLKKLSIEYKFGIVGTNDGDKIVKPATSDQQAGIYSIKLAEYY